LDPDSSTALLEKNQNGNGSRDLAGMTSCVTAYGEAAYAFFQSGKIFHPIRSPSDIPAISL
jgi:hypothetical protein